MYKQYKIQFIVYKKYISLQYICTVKYIEHIYTKYDKYMSNNIICVVVLAGEGDDVGQTEQTNHCNNLV